MVNCSYCGGVLGKRLVFCKPSHKVMYHKRKSSQKDTINKEVAVSNVPTGKIKLDKKGYCPHFILGGNNCRSCNE